MGMSSPVVMTTRTLGVGKCPPSPTCPEVQTESLVLHDLFCLAWPLEATSFSSLGNLPASSIFPQDD